MKHTWNIHMSMLFTSHPRLKIKCQKLTRKNLFLLTRGYGWFSDYFYGFISNWFCKFDHFICSHSNAYTQNKL